MKSVPLGKLTILVSSGSTPLGGSKIYLPSGPVMLIRSQNVLMRELNLDDVAFITEEVASKMKRTVVKTNDVFLNITGASIGRVATFELQGVQANVNQHVCIVRTVPELLHHRYLMHFIAQPSFQAYINNTQQGGTRQALTFEKIRDFQIPLPPLEEQRRIAAILDKADAVRRKRKEAIALTEELLRSAFLEMFGDPATNPMSWKTAILAEVCTKVTDGTHHMPNTVENGIPILRALNIKNDKIDKSNLVYISEEDYGKISKRSPLEKGDVLLTCLGTIGNVALFEEEFKFTLVRNVALIKPNYERTTSQFLQLLLKSNYLQAQMKARAKQSSQAALYIGEIEKLKIFIPPMSLQRRFSKVSENLRKLLQKQQQDQSQQDNLFNSLLQSAFRGEL
jgi:type I restriction enzyme S subunit